jgi:hypothetical protein
MALSSQRVHGVDCQVPLHSKPLAQSVVHKQKQVPHTYELEGTTTKSIQPKTCTLSLPAFSSASCVPNNDSACSDVVDVGVVKTDFAMTPAVRSAA